MVSEILLIVCFKLSLLMYIEEHFTGGNLAILFFLSVFSFLAFAGVEIT